MQSMQVLQLLYGCAYFDPVAEKKRRSSLHCRMITKYEKHGDELESNEPIGDSRVVNV